MEPNEVLIDLIENAIDDVMDIDSNSRIWATSAATALTKELTNPLGANLHMLLDVLADYVLLEQNGIIDGAGRYSPADVNYHATELAKLLESEKAET